MYFAPAYCYIGLVAGIAVSLFHRPAVLRFGIVFKDKLKAFLGAAAASKQTGAAAAPAREPSQLSLQPEFSRQSAALAQFFSYLHGQPGLEILDLGGSTQENVVCLNAMGFRPRPDGFLHALDTAFGTGRESLEKQTSPEAINQFSGLTLDHPVGSFDAVLAWDTLQYLEPRLFDETVQQIHALMRPGAPLLAMFYSGETPPPAVTNYSFRLLAADTMKLIPVGSRPLGQLVNNRSLERAFRHFSTTKFFLTRENMREVLVRK